jgi:thiol:disulfide interchange protein DsbC
VDAVEPTPIPGFYEVRAGRSIFYMDQNGRYVVIGELYDFTTRKNLTAQRLRSLSAVAFGDLPIEFAILLGPANGSRRLALFTDVDCPYSKQFHAQVLPQLLKENVTVYAFLFPVRSVNPDAEAKSEAIWCSQDRAAALDDYIRAGSAPVISGPCTLPLGHIRQLARKLNVTGTPTLILDTGARIDGYAAHEAVLALWEQRK